MILTLQLKPAKILEFVTNNQKTVPHCLKKLMVDFKGNNYFPTKDFINFTFFQFKINKKYSPNNISK